MDSGESITPTRNQVAEQPVGRDFELEPVLAAISAGRTRRGNWLPAMTSRLPGSYCVSCTVNRQAVPCLPGAGVKGLALVKQASRPAARPPG
jgi:hypothetical protein